MKDCVKLRPTGSYAGKQGFTYNEGISTESVGSTGICMHLLTIPPGGRAKAHKHLTHETAIYMLEGVTVMHWGQSLNTPWRSWPATSCTSTPTCPTCPTTPAPAWPLQ